MTLNTAGYEFRVFLRGELKSRMEFNKSYSLRAFAKSLDVSPSNLSMILNGKTPVSLKFIDNIGSKLNLEKEKIYEYQLGLLKEKSGDQGLNDFEFIESSRFKIIKNWYHYAILNLMRVKGFSQSTSWISKRLKISINEVQIAIENLQKAKFINDISGKWVDTSSSYTSHTNNKKSSEYAKENQLQLFSKAHSAINDVNFEYRNHTGVTIAININDLDEAKEFITKFRKQFIKKFDKEADADEVYHLSLALFPLSHNK
jgi:transcriptional regulator with XRE-family HTH domain